MTGKLTCKPVTFLQAIRTVSHRLGIGANEAKRRIEKERDSYGDLVCLDKTCNDYLDIKRFNDLHVCTDTRPAIVLPAPRRSVWRTVKSWFGR